MPVLVGICTSPVNHTTTQRHPVQALPARLGGLGISIPSIAAEEELQSSLLVTSTLSEHILSQYPRYGHDIISKQLEHKKFVRERNRTKVLQMQVIYIRKPSRSTTNKSTGSCQREGSVDLAHSPTISIEHGFTLHKGDALILRYGWIPADMPSQCTCGKFFSVEHAMSYAKGQLGIMKSDT